MSYYVLLDVDETSESDNITGGVESTKKSLKFFVRVNDGSFMLVTYYRKAQRGTLRVIIALKNLSHLVSLIVRRRPLPLFAPDDRRVK